MSAIQQLLASYGAFNPLTIPSLTEWFDYRTLASVGNGNPIGSWAGNKGLYTLAQSGTARPTYVTDDGDGRAAAQFDGVNDGLDASITNSALFGGSGDYEFWIVARLAVTQSYSGGLFTSSGVSNQIGLNAANSTTCNLPMSHGSVQVNPSAALLDDFWHVIRCSKSGARRVMEVDGVSVYDASTSVGPYGTGADIFQMGQYFGAYMTGAYRHWMAFNTPLDNTTAANLTTYLQSA